MPRVHTIVVPPASDDPSEPKGWRYKQLLGEFSHWVVGGNHKELVKALTNFRIANQISLGSPENDIDDYFCSRYPANCNTIAGEEQRPVKVFPRSLRERVTTWAKTRYNYAGRVKLVDQDEANRRAQICQDCPQNVSWGDSCSSCVDNTKRILLLIRQNRTPNVEVKGCKLCGHDNTCATMLPKELLEHRTKYDLPDNCWMKAL